MVEFGWRVLPPSLFAPERNPNIQDRKVFSPAEISCQGPALFFAIVTNTVNLMPKHPYPQTTPPG